MGWNFKYRDSDKVVVTAGYVAKADLEETGFTVIENYSDGPIPTLISYNPAPVFLKKYNTETQQIEDNT